MNEHEIGKRLMDGHQDRGTASPPAVPTAQSLLRRDRRRHWMLVGFIVTLWLAVAGGAIYVAYVHYLLVVPRASMLMLDQGPAPDTPEHREWFQTHFRIFVQLSDYAMAAVTALVVGSVLASLATVLLVVTTRRATLRQINASLADISTQLRQLQEER